MIGSERRFSLKKAVLGNIDETFGYPLVARSLRVAGIHSHRISRLKFRRRRCCMSYSASDGTVEMMTRRGLDADEPNRVQRRVALSACCLVSSRGDTACEASSESCEKILTPRKIGVTCDNRRKVYDPTKVPFPWPMLCCNIMTVCAPNSNSSAQLLRRVL